MACLVLITILALIGVVVLKQVKSSARVATTTSSMPSSPSTTTTYPPASTISISHWPRGLPAAFSAPTMGYVGTNYHGTPLSIASLTKMMTAVIVEQHLPLGISGDGPRWTVSAQDVAMTQALAHQDGITIPVKPGDQLSERLLLEGMLVHSANNYAVMLSELANIPSNTFIGDMNQEARSLGMTQTTYVDTNGISKENLSTPSDQVLVAQKLESYPLLSRIVTMPSVQIPNVGSEPSYTPLVGTNGVIGIKSGTLAATGASDALAIAPIINGVTTPIYVSVLHVVGYPNIAIAGATALSIAHEVATYIQHS